MSGTANRPFGVGPYGTGPYATYATPTVVAGARGGVLFSAQATPGVTRNAGTLGGLTFRGRVTLQHTWPHVQLCVPGTWGKAA